MKSAKQIIANYPQMEGKDKVCAVNELMINNLLRNRISEVCNVLSLPVEEKNDIDKLILSGKSDLSEHFKVIYSDEYKEELLSDKPNTHISDLWVFGVKDEHKPIDIYVENIRQSKIYQTIQ